MYVDYHRKWGCVKRVFVWKWFESVTFLLQVNVVESAFIIIDGLSACEMRIAGI